MLSGSQEFFNSRKASVTEDPNIFSVKTPRRIPSPCSPLKLPPNSRTRSAISVAIDSEVLSPSKVLMLTSGRMCRHPTDAWP